MPKDSKNSIIDTINFLRNRTKSAELPPGTDDSLEEYDSQKDQPDSTTKTRNQLHRVGNAVRNLYREGSELPSEKPSHTRQISTDSEDDDNRL